MATITCQACRFVSSTGLNFCGQCGQPLDGGGPGSHGGAQRVPVGATRDRRPLTILFCDLVGSTALAAGMDAEDFGDLVAAYFERCDTVLRRYGGYVDREEGDSLRVYFGYPQAGDDDALCAVRAALDIVAAVAHLGASVGRALDVRIGIATGEVIAGEPPAAGKAVPRVVGQTPNLARRLEEAAPTGSIYLSATTWRLVERRFDAEPLGQLLLKGLPQPVEVFKLTGAKAPASLVEQFERRALAPMVSRDDELALLEQRWTLACQGRGQVVLVEGEPGIGKSRLMHAFLSRPERSHCRVLTAQCQQLFANSAFSPLVDLLQRTLGLRPEQDKSAQVAALRAAFDAERLPEKMALPLVCRLLDLPFDTGPAEASPRALRQATLEWLSRWLSGTDTSAPVALVVEDLHWADASTLDCLSDVIDRAGPARLLVVLTHRPDFVPPWASRQHVLRWALRRIDTADARALAQNIAGAAPLSEAILQRVAEQSDGVPLFVEELTKMLLERRGGLNAFAPVKGESLAIPETLRGSLAARLDHLRHAKGVAQIAAVLGREFNTALLRDVAEIDEGRLQLALDELVDAELLFKRGAPPAETFAFKHVLVQEAAYASLLKGPRANYHERAAGVLVARFEELVQRHPELVAQHFAAAGSASKACEYWQRAGRRALDASADVEAVEYLRLALGQLEAVQERAAHHDREVDCLVTLGSALMSMRGYAAPEVENAFARAHALCETLGDTEKLYSALTGLHSFYQVRGSLIEAVAFGRRLVDIAEARGDTLWRAQSHRCLGWSLFCNGQTTAGADHLHVALGLFDRLRASEHARIHGAHPWVVGFVNTAYLECFAGRRSEALRRSREALALARDLGQPLALAYALCMSAAMQAEFEEPQATLQLADEAVAVATRHGLPYWTSWGGTLRGWALVQIGQHDQGLVVLHAGLDAYRATGAQLFVASSLALLARSHAAIGNSQQALQAVETALAHPLLPVGYFYTSELHRLHGALLAASGRHAAQARAATERALAVAQAQGAAGSAQRASDQLVGLRTAG